MILYIFSYDTSRISCTPIVCLTQKLSKYSRHRISTTIISGVDLLLYRLSAEGLVSCVLCLWQFPIPELHLSKQDDSIASQFKSHDTWFAAVTSLCNSSQEDRYREYTETLTRWNMNSHFDLQVALTQLKVKSQTWKVIKVLVYFLISSENMRLNFWQVWCHFKAKGNKVGEGCLILAEMLPFIQIKGALLICCSSVGSHHAGRHANTHIHTQTHKF